MQYRLRQIVSFGTTIVLTIATLIGIPLKAYVERINHDPKCVERGPLVWTPHMVKVYTKGYIDIMHPTWNRSEWKALLKLWDAESHWNPYAYNHTVETYSGKHAGGVAQMLGVTTKTPAPQQVARGLSYIKTRYGKPSVAWAHERRHGWY